MKMKIIILLLGTLILAASAFAGPGEHEHKMPLPIAGSPEFEQLKAMAGTWKGTAQTGAEAATPAEIDYKVTSNGSAVVETLFPGTPQEMVSIYHDKNGKLSMTHYCAFRNQPQLDLQSSDGKIMQLALSPASGIQPTEDHMDSLKLAFEGNKLTQTWQCVKGGKPGDPTVISVAKV